MEELLREAACLGNLDAVQKLLERGASVNSQHSLNGWTALHWASRRGHVAIVRLLLEKGADVNIVSGKGESVVDVTSDDQVLKILKTHGLTQKTRLKPEESSSAPDFIPNYLQYPTFPHYDIHKSVEKLPHRERVVFTSLAVTKRERELPDSHASGLSLAEDMGGLSLVERERRECKCECARSLAPHSSPPLVVKVRVSGSGELDFVEAEVAPPTYSALVSACCEELDLTTSDVAKVRKLPNVLVRKDRDVQRMRDGQELELVLKDKPNQDL